MLHLHFTSAWASVLGALAIVLLINGIDDLVPTAICCWHVAVRKRGTFRATSSAPDKQRRIAIFVPCWKEAAVIGQMVRHNLASVQYRNYTFFLGVYPNDVDTVAVVRQLAAAYPSVQAAMCPHPGPTSKADCLNWIYALMVQYELLRGDYFDTIVLHDAEDLIHPEALSVINWERARNAMVQVPVLPLKTPVTDVTHGVYCDDFAEYQIVDMRARQFCGSFVPSNGVGTGFARHILHELYSQRNGVVFDPGSLTEDYEIGVHIYNAGFAQAFAPLRKSDRGFIATREYFPRRVKSAIRQRTRWVTGIALQSWARDGWRGSWGCKYWFWRDRKGLFMNPLSFLTNVLFIAGVVDYVLAVSEHRPWHFAVADPHVLALCWATGGLQCLRLALKTMYTGRIYGPVAGLTVPTRALLSNWINCCASLHAIWNYAQSKWGNRALVWQKTEHAYPVIEMAPALSNLATALNNSRVEAQRSRTVTTARPATVDVRRVQPRVAHIFPAAASKRLGILPYAIESGKLLVARSSVPNDEAFRELRTFTELQIEFHELSESNFADLLRVTA